MWKQSLLFQKYPTVKKIKETPTIGSKLYLFSCKPIKKNLLSNKRAIHDQVPPPRIFVYIPDATASSSEEPLLWLMMSQSSPDRNKGLVGSSDPISIQIFFRSSFYWNSNVSQFPVHSKHEPLIDLNVAFFDGRFEINGRIGNQISFLNSMMEIRWNDLIHVLHLSGKQIHDLKSSIRLIQSIEFLSWNRSSVWLCFQRPCWLAAISSALFQCFLIFQT